ncbi:hypothetical protein HZA26_03650 [Candidatus Nomurabacteria bacterium]|nr:hypothetical protein [Candidatus Nomurabacteria bacterium]
MIESTLWLRELIVNYPAFQYLLIFFGTALGGEAMLIGFSFLSAQGVLSPSALVIFGSLGTYLSDIALFLLSRTRILHNIISHRYANKTASLIVEALLRIGKGKHLLALVIAKFLIGTRVVLVLYGDRTDIEFKKFALYNSVATIVWILVVGAIGFLLGLGFTYLSEVFKNIYAGIGLVLLFLLLAFMVEMWVKKKFTEGSEDIK